MTRPILTVTLNPAIDRTVWVDQLVPGTTHRTAETGATFGGKEINVARVVARIGSPVIAMGLAGEDQASAIEHHLESLGGRSRFLRVPGETRTNLKVVEQATGRLTEINGSGPEVTPDLIAALEGELLAMVNDERVGVVVFAGSLPLGVDASVYARWTVTLRSAWPELPVLVDASDEALDLATRAAPFLVKPNRIEAVALTGDEIGDVEDAVQAARAIAGRGPRTVLLSLGAQGAVALCDGVAEFIEARPIDLSAGQLQSTVGAGDAMVARIAVELAKLDGAPVGGQHFFAMSRLAVAEAESQIGAPERAQDRIGTTARAPASVAGLMEGQGAVPMVE